MSDKCFFCHNEVNKDDPNTWKLVSGWVGGPKKDSMRLRDDMGCFAHDRCIQKIIKGLPPGQPDLFEEDEQDDEPEPTRRFEHDYFDRSV